jgi:Flp pilus assembly protein TadG
MDRKDKDRGQSLIEIAIILPILLLLLLGVVEVGMGLRNYLIVVNANREGARFAAHGRYDDDESMQILLDAGGTMPFGAYAVPFLRTDLVQNPAGGGLLDVNEMTPNTGIIITHVEFPANYEHAAAFQNAVMAGVTRVVTGVTAVSATEIVSPQVQIIGRDDIRWLWPDGRDSRVNLQEIINRHGPATSDIRQARLDEGLRGMRNHIIIVETFYMHHPLGEGLVPSPWVMYAQMEVRDASE